MMFARSTPPLLVVNDRKNERELLSRVLRAGHFRVRQACQPEQALGPLGEGVSMVLSRWQFRDRDGLELLECWQAKHPAIPFLFVSDDERTASAVRAIKAGAVHYLTLPLASDRLLRSVQACLPDDAGLSASERLGVPGRLSEADGQVPILGTSAAMQPVFHRIARAAATASTVLVTGESGTGKELVARAVHEAGPRSQRPFVALNIAAVPDSLVESELFGHAKGAFTDADQARAGRFEAADGGTLFIDEIGDIPLSTQSKLLRVLESQRFSPVGGNGEVAVDVRVVAATSRNLEQQVVAGDFRADLYYRLNVIRLELPPLRDRAGDVRLLADYFLEEFCRRYNKPPLVIDDALSARLENAIWPGNVRQLRNVIESMVVLGNGPVLTLSSLPARFAGLQSPVKVRFRLPATATLTELERLAIHSTLKRFNGNRARTASSLGVSLRTLQRKLRRAT